MPLWVESIHLKFPLSLLLKLPPITCEIQSKVTMSLDTIDGKAAPLVKNLWWNAAFVCNRLREKGIHRVIVASFDLK